MMIGDYLLYPSTYILAFFRAVSLRHHVEVHGSIERIAERSFESLSDNISRCIRTLLRKTELPSEPRCTGEGENCKKLKNNNVMGYTSKEWIFCIFCTPQKIKKLLF